MAGFWRWLVADDRWVDDELVEVAYLAVKHFRPSMRFVRPTRFSDAELASLQVPVLLLEGEQLAVYDPRQAIVRARRLIAGAQADLVPDAGELYGHALAHVIPRLLAFPRPRHRRRLRPTLAPRPPTDRVTTQASGPSPPGR